MQKYERNISDDPVYFIDPDTESMSEYLAGLEKMRRKEKRPARIMNTISIILTVLGSMGVTFCCCVYPNLLINNSYFLRRFNFVALTIVLICITLVPGIIISVINKIRNPRNITPLVVIIFNAVVILIAAIIFAGLGIDKKSHPKNYSLDLTESDDIPYFDEIISCLESHGFDVALHDDSIARYKAFGWDYKVDLYISSEASPEKLAEVNKFLKELRDICKKAGTTKEKWEGMEVRITFKYYCPDEEEGFYPDFPITIKAHITDDFLIIEEKIDYITSNYSKYAGSVKTELDSNQDALIVVK